MEDSLKLRTESEKWNAWMIRCPGVLQSTAITGENTYSCHRLLVGILIECLSESGPRRYPNLGQYGGEIV
jgi:hypothetical protein